MPFWRGCGCCLSCARSGVSPWCLGEGTCNSPYPVVMATSDVEELIDKARRVVGGPGEGEWFDELDGNRSALDDHVRSVLDGGDPEAISHVGGRLWGVLGSTREGRQRLARERGWCRRGGVGGGVGGPRVVARRRWCRGVPWR